MKKIIFYMPNIENGGIEKNLVILSNYLINKDYKIEIYYSSISKEIFCQINPKIILIKSKDYINFFFIRKRIINSFNCAIHLFFNIRKESAIVLSMQDHPLAIIATKIKNVACITRIANHPEASIKFFNNFFFYKIKLYIKIIFYRFANGIICNSNASKKFLKKKINNIRIINIFNPSPLYKHVKIINRKMQILSVGRLEKQKNFFGIVLALNELKNIYPNLKLIIIGSGQEKLKIIKLSKDLGVVKMIKFKNFINPNKYFLNSKIFILNSFFEGLPNVLIEALNFKIPIISTNCESGPKEILKNGKYGFLIPVNNYSALSKKIIFLLTNYKLAQNKAFMGYKSLDRFNVKKQCYKYEKFLSSFV